MQPAVSIEAELVDFNLRCERVASLAELETLWRDRMHAFGFVHAALGAHVDPLRPAQASYVFHTYPSEWIARFSSRGYGAIDPVYRSIEGGVSNFEWSDPDFLRGLTWRQRHILFEAREFGLRFGRTHALAPVLNLSASGSFVSELPDMPPATYMAAKIANIVVHNRAAQLCADTLPAVPELAPRERQCLQLAGRGLTDPQIARELSISVSTVRRHIESARTRMRVSSRIAAVTRAIGSGQIQPWSE